MMRTANPALNSKTFQNLPVIGTDSGTMTIQGTVNKTGILLFILVSAAAVTWQKAGVDPGAVSGLMMVGVVGGLITAIVTVFRQFLKCGIRGLCFRLWG